VGERRLFISHTSEDAAVADAIVAYLEAHGVPCWISSRDIPPQSIYAEEITQGIEECRSCVVIVSEAANNSAAVKRELELTSHLGKPFIPIRIDNAEPGRGLAYYLRNTQWIDYGRERERALDRIVAHVAGVSRTAPPSPSQPTLSSEPEEPPRGGVNVAVWAVGASVALVLAMWGVSQLGRQPAKPAEPPATELATTDVATPQESAPNEPTQTARPTRVAPSSQAPPSTTAAQSNPLNEATITSVAGTTWRFPGGAIITFMANGTFINSGCQTGTWRQTGVDIAVAFREYTSTGRIENNRLAFSYWGPKDTLTLAPYDDMNCIEPIPG
jgi:hypothetical protein